MPPSPLLIVALHRRAQPSRPSLGLGSLLGVWACAQACSVVGRALQRRTRQRMGWLLRRTFLVPPDSGHDFLLQHLELVTAEGLRAVASPLLFVVVVVSRERSSATRWQQVESRHIAVTASARSLLLVVSSVGFSKILRLPVPINGAANSPLERSASCRRRFLLLLVDLAVLERLLVNASLVQGRYLVGRGVEEVFDGASALLSNPLEAR